MNRKLLLLVVALGSMSAFAGAKEDFVAAVAAQCPAVQAKAEELATPGRTGNVVRFSMCAESPMDIGEGCKLTCNKSSATIGN